MFKTAIKTALVLGGLLLGAQDAFASGGNWIYDTYLPSDGLACAGSSTPKTGLTIQPCLLIDETTDTVSSFVYFRNSTKNRMWIGVPEAKLVGQQSDGRSWPFETVRDVKEPGGCATTSLDPGQLVYCRGPEHTFNFLGWLGRNIQAAFRLAADGSYYGAYATPVAYRKK